jgi:hypothetical protein
MRKDAIAGYCNDMPLPFRVDELWQKEMEALALSSPHFVCANTIYFKCGRDVMAMREGETPEVVESPAIINRVYTSLGFSVYNTKSKSHHC